MSFTELYKFHWKVKLLRDENKEIKILSRINRIWSDIEFLSLILNLSRQKIFFNEVEYSQRFSVSKKGEHLLSMILRVGGKHLKTMTTIDVYILLT